MNFETWFWVAVVGILGAWKALKFFGKHSGTSIMPSFAVGPFYWIYGVTLLMVFSAAQYWGWGFLDSDKVKNVPKSVRQNPGVYRSHYRSYGRTYGGK